jgi:hypothetical protein
MNPKKQSNATLHHTVTKESILKGLTAIEHLLASSYGQGKGKRLLFCYDIGSHQESYALITLDGRLVYPTLDEAIAAYNHV